MQMHPDYFRAKRELDRLVDAYPHLQDHTVMLGRRWDEILDKDPTGQQCLHYVHNLKELLTPMEQ